MSVAMNKTKYKLEFFKNRENEISAFDQFLPKETIDIINKLAQHVGAPEYQKTPVFKRDENFRRRQPAKTTTVEDWENMRNFKTTVLVKSKDAIDKNIDEIRCVLNKITSKNYSEMHKTVIELLEKVLKEDPEEEELLKVGNSIFEIGSMNKFWSKLYAQLLKDIMGTFPIMKTIYDKNFNSFIKLFDEINYVKAEEDYDKFCLINKENEKRRALSSFFVHLMNYGLLGEEVVGNIIIKLVSMFEKNMYDSKHKEIINELGENICIFMKEGNENLQDNFNEIEQINSFMKFVSEASHKEYNGLTSKVIFKFIDLLEMN